MPRRPPGLYLKRGIWQIDKRIFGVRIRKSCETRHRDEAEKRLSLEVERARRALIYGERVRHTFDEGAARYVEQATHKTLERDIQSLRKVMPFIGHLDMLEVHDGTLAPFVAAQKAAGLRSGTVRRDLSVVRRVLTLAARSWRDASGLTWLPEVPLITMPDWNDARRPMPASWEEQRALLRALPPHLHRAALYAVNTGLRDTSQARLRWEWECQVPELGCTVFVIPGRYMKNDADQVVVHNRIAADVLDACRGKHAEYVFTYKGQPVTRLANNAWKSARIRAGLPEFRWHDWRHTFARRLRAARVPQETRAALLGHKSRSMTTHYSAAELQELIDAVSLLEQQTTGTLLRAIG